MNVLCHGIPFCCNYEPARRYAGPHDIRLLGWGEESDFRYDPGTETFQQVVDRISGEWRPDLALFWVPEMVPPPLEVEDSPIPTVALVSDWNIYHFMLARNLGRYDVVLCDKAGLEVFRSDLVAPRHLFPLYAQISSVHRPYPVEKDIDVAFVGSLNHAAHARRGHFLERLAALAQRYRVVIVGNVEPVDYARLLSRARIVFNHSIRGELNLRVFETFACGSLALLEEDNLEAGDWFEDGRELVLYNAENFEERIAYFLGHPDEAAAIAARGHARAAEFAGENRFTQLIDWAAAQPSQGRRFRELPMIERRYEDLLMYGYSQHSHLQRLEASLLAELGGSMSSDPRFWTAMGKHILNPMRLDRDEAARRTSFAKAFLHAYRLAPESAPHAMNAAKAFEFIGQPEAEAACLRAALNAGELDGAELLLGSHTSPFWVRWKRAVAEKQATLDMLHAEAHIRLGSVLHEHGDADAAEKHLEQARALDACNYGGLRLLANLQWARGGRVEALETMRRLISLSPLDCENRLHLCGLYRDLGLTAEALALAEETFTFGKTTPDEPNA